MIKLSFDNSLQKVLCLGAHSDDIEIGCGGTILNLIKQIPNLSVCWVVFGTSGDTRKEEAWLSANKFLSSVKQKKILIKEFRDGFFPYIGMEIKEFFEQIKEDFSPDLILTHYRQDLHQDHRIISDLTWNTFRNHLILEYEIPKYDGDFGHPNFFVHLNELICKQKIENILGSFGTQANKQWFSEETFSSILRLRGIESNAPDKYAEAFYCRKVFF